MGWLPEKYEAARIHFLKSGLDKNDKNAVCNLVDRLLATSIKKDRATRYYDDLRRIIEHGWLHTYQNITEAELYHCLTEIEHDESIGIWTKRDYKITLKRLLENLHNPIASIIKTNKHFGKQQMPKAFLTVHDILRMVNSPWPHLRDKAMTACLYESCCRPHEFFMLRRQDIRFDIVPAKIWDGNGGQTRIELEMATLNVSNEAKTGGRPVPLVFTVPWLKAWLRQAGGTEYIWTKIRGANAKKHIEYWEARKALKQLACAAGVEKEKAHFYAERHGRSTEVSRHMTQAQQSQYAGWVQGSRMPRTYIHLSGKDVIAPLLSPFGITVETGQSERDVWLEIMKVGREQLRAANVEKRSSPGKSRLQGRHPR